MLNDRGNPKLKEAFKTYHEHYKDLLTQTRSNYVANKLQNSHNVTAGVWAVINSFRTCSDKSCRDFIINHNGIFIKDQLKIANIFNEYFSSVGESINDKHKNLQYCFKGNPSEHSIYLAPTNCEEIKNIISSLKPSSSAGHDGVNVNVLKACSQNISVSLSVAVNNIIESGTFPDRLKIAQVTPIFKKGDKNKIENCRPISILPVFSKIVEKVIYNRIINFLNKHNLMFENQNGFLKGKSTSTAAAQLIEEVLSGIEIKEHIAGVYLDLEKAFDCVNVDILLVKLWNIGIRGTAYDLIKSYMSNRKQFVLLKTESGVYKSNITHIKYGVPQCSVLGPLLFLIYVNDIKYCRLNLKIVLYADDTSIVCKKESCNELETQCNNVTKEIVQYFNESHLNVSTSKTCLMEFNKSSLNDEIKLYIGNELVKTESSVKFLGLIIQNNLKWDKHVDSLATKLSKNIFAINTISKYCKDTKVLKTAYHALFSSHLDYGIEIWGATTKANLDKLLTLQKRAVRIICGAKHRESCRNLFPKTGVLTVVNMYIMKAILLVKRLHPNTYLDFHQYNTRNKEKFYISSHRTTLYKKGPQCAGIKLANALPSAVMALPTIKLKFQLKKLLQQNPFYTLEEYYNYMQNNKSFSKLCK